MIDLSIITITHQSAVYIEDLILSVIGAVRGLSYEHIIVDNASTDGTVERIERDFSAFVTLIISKENIGFARAHVLAMEKAKGRSFLFLNPDMRMGAESFYKMFQWFEGEKDVGIAGCCLQDPLGQPIIASFPRKDPKFLRELLWLFCLRQADIPRDFDYKTTQSVEMVKGAFMLLKGEVIASLGRAFDPRYFLLFEDFDLCREARASGKQVVFYADYSCTDWNSRSFAHYSREWIYRQMVHSLCLYFRKWHGFAPFCLLKAASAAGLLLRRHLLKN